MRGLDIFFYLVVAVTCTFLWSVEGRSTISICGTELDECKTECQQKSCSCNKHLGRCLDKADSLDDEGCWKRYEFCWDFCDGCQYRCSLFFDNCRNEGRVEPKEPNEPVEPDVGGLTGRGLAR
ncbi:hypothetical protein ScPMuIL_008175 [Solemya velum]